MEHLGVRADLSRLGLCGGCLLAISLCHLLRGSHLGLESLSCLGVFCLKTNDDLALLPFVFFSFRETMFCQPKRDAEFLP